MASLGDVVPRLSSGGGSQFGADDQDGVAADTDAKGVCRHPRYIHHDFNRGRRVDDVQGRATLAGRGCRTRYVAVEFIQQSAGIVCQFGSLPFAAHFGHPSIVVLSIHRQISSGIVRQMQYECLALM
jgi:hypothetical protein